MLKYLTFIKVLLSSLIMCVQTAGAESPVVLSVVVDDGITPFMADYIKLAINEADARNAAALLINLDTPGGLYETTREIVQSMLASPVPIIVYVTPKGARAGSAGVFIALAADILAMAPSTNIGAAHPVEMSGDDVKGDMNTKVTNDAKAWARSIAETKKRNAEWAEKAVTGSEAISAVAAVEIGVADFLANDVEHLIAQAHGRRIHQFEKTISLNLMDAKVQPVEMTIQQRFMKFLANPNLLYILLLLGLLGVLIEFQSPGLIVPGLFGVICLAVVFGVQILPINWFGALLILGATALFIAEIFITSFGLLAIGGFALLIIGSYLLFNVPGSGFYVEPLIIWLLSAGLAITFLVVAYLLLKARRQGPTANVDALVGTRCVVVEEIKPPDAGLVRLHGVYWQAFAEEHVDKDEHVIVKRVESTKIYVAKETKD